jgi:hypothetical protein
VDRATIGINPARVIFEKITRYSRASAILAEPSCAVKDKKHTVCSPNLNLIERLWRFLEKIFLYNPHYKRFADFKGAILKFFANIKQYRSELESLMTLNFHTLGR